MKAGWIACVVSLAACGDDGGAQNVDARQNADAPDIDAPSSDAPASDAPIDAPQLTTSGSISLFEIAVLNPGTSGTFFGQGIRMAIQFLPDGSLPGPLMEEAPGSPVGCKVWEYTAAQAGVFALGSDEGTVQVSSPAGTGSMLLPPCSFVPGSGYLCPQPGTSSTGGVIAAGPQAGLATLTDADVTYNATNTSNRYILITNATNAANNGTFPIVAVAGANTVVYVNPAVVAETLPAAAIHVNLAGVGPSPMAPDPGFLQDTVSLDFTLTAGGMNEIADFTSTTTAAGSVGDDFTLAIGELNELNAIPKNGAAFTIACDPADCPTGSANASILEIVTTDRSTAGLSPIAMPPPITKQVRLRCTAIGATSVTVPAAYSAVLMSSGATRMEATFSRATLMSGGPANVSSASGHAIVGYTN